MNEQVFFAQWVPFDFVLPFLGLAAGTLFLRVVAAARPSLEDDSESIFTCEPSIRSSEVVTHKLRVKPATTSQAYQPSALERRRYIRENGNFAPLLVKGCNGTQDIVLASLVDRSLGGLCVATQMEVAAGTRLLIRPDRLSHTLPWVSVEVRHCRKSESGWYLGCKFTDDVPLEIVNAFG